MNGSRFSNDGFSLVEVLVTVGILSFAVTTLLASISGSITLNAVNRNAVTALAHAETVLEDIRCTPSSSITGMVDSGAWTMTGKKLIENGFVPLKGEKITTVYEGIWPITINVSVEWQDNNGRLRHFDLSTIEGGA